MKMDSKIQCNKNEIFSSSSVSVYLPVWLFTRFAVIERGQKSSLLKWCKPTKFLINARLYLNNTQNKRICNFSFSFGHLVCLCGFAFEPLALPFSAAGLFQQKQTHRAEDKKCDRKAGDRKKITYLFCPTLFEQEEWQLKFTRVPRSEQRRARRPRP